MNRPMVPLAHVCQRASAKPSAASRAIRPATVGESVRPVGGRGGCGLVPSESLVAAITRLPPVAASGPSGRPDAATCLRAIHAPDLALVHSFYKRPRFLTDPRAYRR